MRIYKTGLANSTRSLRTWLCAIALCLGPAACISPDLEPPGGSADTSLPGPRHAMDAGAANTVPAAAGSHAAPAASTTAPSASMAAAGSAAPGTPGAAQAPDRAESTQTMRPAAGGAAGSAASADDADAGVPEP